ncbi:MULTISPECIES: hypothetical protein [unclassified Spiroplasma]|uniref:hypothetical protein n=1 Tax=unclassified Spiroplasma TaxID=2637901 RepID=UPI0030D47A39
MNKRYLLVINTKYTTNTLFFYTLEETKITAEENSSFRTTIIDLENENIKWQGVE